MEGKKMWFVVVVAMVLMCSSTGQASKSDCMKQCITDCADGGGSLCVVGCAGKCRCTISFEFESCIVQNRLMHRTILDLLYDSIVYIFYGSIAQDDLYKHYTNPALFICIFKLLFYK